MPRAFVLTGGSRSQLGLLEQARALGHEVCVIDGAGTAPLLAEADHGIVRSFTDVEGVLADLVHLGIEPVAVATMGSDQAVLPTARLAEQLGLPGLPVRTALIVLAARGLFRGVTNVRATPHSDSSRTSARSAARTGTRRNHAGSKSAA